MVEPLPAIVASFCVLGVLLYKRVNLGITLNVTALVLALLAVDLVLIPQAVYGATNPQTSDGRLAISVVFATFGVMLLSQLYKETGFINRLSSSLGSLIKNPKVVLSVLPAVIGFLPVAGGALMSAPLVDAEANKLKLSGDRKAYVNLWFRHTIFPVYPISQVLIMTAALTGTTVVSIILRQIPVVAVMVVVGYLVGFRGAVRARLEDGNNRSRGADLKEFAVSFSPILVTIVVAISLGSVGFAFSKQGFDALIATFVGLGVLIVLSRMSLETFAKPLRGWGIYGVTAAAYGAFLLRNVLNTIGIAQLFPTGMTNGSAGLLLLLTLAPAVLAFLTGSPSGGIAIGASILAGLVTFSPATASLLYMSAYLGYTVAPTHLCFTFTAEYFKTSIAKVYKYVIPSFVVTYAATLLVYLLLA